MDTELKDFLAEIEAYLVATGIAPTVFGRGALNDPAVMSRMREGRPITTRSMSAMRRFMEANPPVDAI